MWETFGDVLLDALLDTLKLLPFLFVLYILIELMEHNTGVGRPRRALAGKWAPLLGAGLGIVPMCGFSVMAAKLYRHRHITVGALLAVLITTSDEALLVLLLAETPWLTKLVSILALVGVKFVLAVGIGYLADFLVGEKQLAPLPDDKKEGGHVRDRAFENDHAHHEHDHGHEHEQEHEQEHEHEHGHEAGEEVHSHGECECNDLSPCEHKKENKFSMYVLSPLVHALKIAAFVLLVNFAFGLAVALADPAVLMQGAAYWLQPVVCALIGLIPNCAASVILAEAYALGGIGFGGLVAGLVTGAGLGSFILLKETPKRGCAIVAVLLLLGLITGYLANAAMLLL